MMESRIRRLARTLLDATTDADLEVQQQIRNSLCALGEAEPEEILQSCQEFLCEQDKLPHPHRALILLSMDFIIRNHLQDLGKPLAASLVALASHEMTKSKDSLPGWQGAASSLLVSVGRKFLGKAMEEILGKFQPGVPPHPFVLRSLAELAAANVFGMVPFLNSILGTLLPMLGMAKADSMKCEFCYALQRFSESIQEYFSNLSEAPDPTIREDLFSQEFSDAFDVLFSSWLQHREPKVRQAALEALGSMSSLIPKEKLEEQIPKLLPAVLSLYRKHPEAFPISKSLCQILESSAATGSRNLESQLEFLLNSLLTQICSPVDPEIPSSAKNHSELLRCFSVLGCSFPDRVLLFLFSRLESNSATVRAAAVLLLRHLINSAPSQMELKKSFILSSMKLPLHDSNNKVKKALVQLISALALHGFLEHPGGEVLLQFLISQCCLSCQQNSGIPAADSEDFCDSSIRKISVDTLLLLSTTVDRMSHVLWPFLLQFLIPAQFSSALTPLCRSLTFLAAKFREEQLEKETKPRGNIPSPQALTARLLSISSLPFLGDSRGFSALRLLQEIRIHPDLEQLWGKEIPKLLETLRENTEDSLCQQEWEEKLLQFLRQSLESIGDKSWISSLASEISQQISNSQLEKNFLYRSLGTTLAVCSDKEFIRKQLQEILENARYQEEEEREGLASCFGICAENHLEETLEKLEEFGKSDVFRKSLGLFSIFKERNDSELEKTRSCLVLCWGRVAQAAPAELLNSHLESPILKNLLLHFHTKVLGIKLETKDTSLKLSLTRSVSMISQALGNPRNSCGNSVSIARKAELVALMVEFLRAEPADSLRNRLRQRALSACALLVRLDPALAEPQRSELLDVALDSVLLLDTGWAGEGQDLLQDALAALTELLQNLLRRQLTPQGLQDLFTHLTPRIRSPRQQERQSALAVSLSLLEFYLEELQVKSVTRFHALSQLLALLSPRCCDGIPEIRKNAVACVRCLLYIQLGYQGFSRDHQDELLEELESLKEKLENPDFSVLFHTCSTVASTISHRIPADQIPPLLFSLLDALEDPDDNCSRAAVVILNCLLRDRGAMLREKVPALLSLLSRSLCPRRSPQLRLALQRSVQLLAMQQLQPVLHCLLSAAATAPGPTFSLWKSLCSEVSLVSPILDNLLHNLSHEIPFLENRSDRAGLGLAAAEALHELMSAPEAAAAVAERLPELLRELLLRLRGPAGRRMRGEAREGSGAARTLQAMLARAGNDDVVREVENSGGWELMGNPERHHDGVAILAGAMAELCGPRIPRIAQSLIPVLGSVYESQRVTSTAFLAELLNHRVVKDLVLLEPLLDALTALENDSSLLVRVLAMRGIGNVASGSPEKLGPHSARLLSSAVRGLDHQDDADNLLALESMRSLCKLLDPLEEHQVRSTLLPVAVRIRPFFDSDHAELRRCSLVLFGNLSRFGRRDAEALAEQILNGLVTLLLHLQDPCGDVVKACKFALRMCGPSVGCEELREMFGNHLREDMGLHYGEFINDVCKYLMRSHPSLLNRLISTNLFYFKSSWWELRAAAAMFIGFLVLHVDEEQSQQVDLDELISALKLLLTDPVAAVRIKVAETLGRLSRLL